MRKRIAIAASGILAATVVATIAFLFASSIQKRWINQNSDSILETARKSNLKRIDSFSDFNIEDDSQFTALEKLRLPWTPGLLLGRFLSSGPLEGNPLETPQAVYISDDLLILSHAWVGGRKWGLFYSPSDVPPPLPFWSQKLKDHWYAWHFGPNGPPPGAPGTWYE